MPSTYNTDVPGAVAALAERGIGEPADGAHPRRRGDRGIDRLRAVDDRGDEGRVRRTRSVPVPPMAVDVATTAGMAASARTLDEPLLDRVDLLVSTVPAEVANGQVHELVEAARAVFDVVYDPWPSHLVDVAEEAELPHVTGLDLLAHQAALQVELMTGGSVPPQLLRDAALLELGRSLVFRA